MIFMRCLNVSFLFCEALDEFMVLNACYKAVYISCLLEQLNIQFNIEYILVDSWY